MKKVKLLEKVKLIILIRKYEAELKSGNMEHLKEGISLRGYANTDPLQAYIKEGYDIFDNMMAKISEVISSAEVRTVYGTTLKRRSLR